MGPVSYTHLDVYKRQLCPECSRPLLGSASRGKTGKYYTAYHCSNHGHYFRVPKDEMEERIMLFVKQLKMEDAKIEALMQAGRDAVSYTHRIRLEPYRLVAAQQPLS